MRLNRRYKRYEVQGKSLTTKRFLKFGTVEGKSALACVRRLPNMAGEYSQVKLTRVSAAYNLETGKKETTRLRERIFPASMTGQNLHSSKYETKHR